MGESKVLTTLQTINTGLALATTAGGIVVPLVTAIVKSIKDATADGGEQKYEVVLEIGQKELLEADANFQSALDTVNAELERLGQPKIEP